MPTTATPPRPSSSTASSSPPSRKSGSTVSSTAPASRRWRPRGASRTRASPPRDLDHVAIGRDPRANLGAKVLQTLRRLRSRATSRSGWQRGEGARRARRARGGARRRRRTLRAKFHNVEHHQAHVGERVLRLAVRRGGRPLDRRLRRLRVDHARASAAATASRSSTASFSRTRSASSTRRVTQWLGFPEVRRRRQGDGPRALRRAERSPRADARARPARRRHFELNLDYFMHHAEGVEMTWDERLADDRPALLRSSRGPARAARASRDGELDEAHEDVAARSRPCSRRRPPRSSGVAQRRPALDEPLPRRRRRAERGRERRILRRREFEDLYIQPAAGDDGTPSAPRYYV